jgi:hypothetical protein
VNNIDFFNRMTLAVLEDLYSFPTPKDIDVKALAISVIPEEAGHEQIWDMLQASEDTIRFLGHEGFLAYHGEYLDGGTFIQSRLTLKGLAVLGSTPESLGGTKSPLIDQIRSALKGGAKTASSEVVKGTCSEGADNRHGSGRRSNWSACAVTPNNYMQRAGTHKVHAPHCSGRPGVGSLRFGPGVRSLMSGR